MQCLWKASFLSGNSWGPREGDTGAVWALLWDGQYISGERGTITIVDDAEWEIYTYMYIWALKMVIKVYPDNMYKDRQGWSRFQSKYCSIDLLKQGWRMWMLSVVQNLCWEQQRHSHRTLWPPPLHPLPYSLAGKIHFYLYSYLCLHSYLSPSLHPLPCSRAGNVLLPKFLFFSFSFLPWIGYYSLPSIFKMFFSTP